MSTERLDDDQGTTRIDGEEGTVRIDDNQGTVRIDDGTVRLDGNQGTSIIGGADGTAIINDAGAGIIPQHKKEMQEAASDEKRTGEVFTPGQIIEINGKNCAIEGVISMSTGEAVIYKINIDGKPFVLKHYKLDTPLREDAKNVLQKIRDNPKNRVIKVSDFGRHHEQDFEIMEYAEGGTLDQYLKDKGPIHDSGILKNFVRQITEGLEQLHGELNIIYQDLKPENIYFRDEGKTSIVLADFGISSPMIPGENRAEVLANATTVYAAPDLARIGNEKYVRVGPPVDYFALGITMMHLWIGAKPFQSIPEAERIRQIRDKDVVFPNDMPDDYKTLIQGLIDPLPKSRWENQHIKKWLAGESLQSNYRKTSIDYESQMFNETEGYANPKELAALMAKYPDRGITCLYSDIVTSWLKKAGDDLRAEEIKTITSKYAQDRQSGLFFTIYTLDPMRPFVSNGGRTCCDTREIADALLAESGYYMNDLKNANARLYLYFEAVEGSQGRQIAEQFCKYFGEYSAKRALNLVYLNLQEDSITIGSKTYQSPEEVAGETDNAQIALVKEAVQEEDSLFLVWLSDQYGEFFESTNAFNSLPAADKFFVLGKFPFLSYKDLLNDWHNLAASDLISLIQRTPGRFDLFEAYAGQGLPFSGQVQNIDWKPTALNYLAEFFAKITDSDTGLQLVHFLIKHGADINESSGDGSSPLVTAVLKRNAPLVNALLEAGVDPDKKDNYSTSLIYALCSNEANEEEDNRIAIANMLMDRKANVSVTDSQNRTALGAAVFLESPEKVDLISRMVKAGADVDAKNSDGCSVLLLATANFDSVKDKQSALAVIELLLKNGAKTNILQNNGYYSPLMVTADRDTVEPAQLLLKYGAQKDFTDTDGNTAYIYAAQKHNSRMMTLLDPGKDLKSKKMLLSCAKFMVSVLAIGSVFVTMDVLARAILTLHLSYPVLAVISPLLSHLLAAYIQIALSDPREYLAKLMSTLKSFGKGLRYIVGIPLIFPLGILLLQFLTRFLPENMVSVFAAPADILTRPASGFGILAGYLLFLAAIMTGTIFFNKFYNGFGAKWHTYMQYTGTGVSAYSSPKTGKIIKSCLIVVLFLWLAGTFASLGNVHWFKALLAIYLPFLVTKIIAGFLARKYSVSSSVKLAGFIYLAASTAVSIFTGIFSGILSGIIANVIAFVIAWFVGLFIDAMAS